MKEEIIEKYIKAGKIAALALKKIYDYISPKKHIDLRDVAEKAESFILESGAKLAFPCNIGFNQLAAHFTPIKKETIVFDKGLLKIDVGAHIDGYIADTAITIARGKEFHDIIRVNKQILEFIIDQLRPGIKLGYLGGIIEDEVKKEGYKVIENLSGHLIDRYNLHAGKNFPNVKEYFSSTIKAGEVYAIEPFVTFDSGAGKVVSGDLITIYSLSKTKKIKDKNLDKVRRYIMSNYGPLPFTYRWMEDVFSEEMLNKLFGMGIIKGYPVLIEAKGVPVSQYEHTVIVLEDEIIVTTNI